MKSANPLAAQQAQPANARPELEPGPGRRATRPLRGTPAGLRNQQGGTMMGLILGAAVGLAVALGVAIYVTKVPVPFVNKAATRSSGQDAAEAQKNKDWDPNAPLRNRADTPPPPSATANGTVAPAPTPALIPAPAEVTPPTARTVPAPAEVTPAARADRPPAPTPATATRVPPSGDPLGDLAAARAGGSAKGGGSTSNNAAVDPFTYFVQAGAFRSQDDADGQRARLSLLGIEARVSEREQAGRTVYRVRVGPLQNRDAADRVKERLDQNGFDAALVRVQR